MPAPSNVFRFPGMGRAAVKPSLPPPPVPSVDVFDAQKARTFHSILENAVEKGRVLSGLVHEDRELAASAGLEGIGIEIGALLDTERFTRMRDALGEAVRLGEGATITHEGLGRLHRLEALVAEGSQVLSRHQTRGKGLGAIRLGSPAPASPDLVLFGAILMLGAVAITLAAFLVARREGSRGPFLARQPVRVPVGIPTRVAPRAPKKAVAVPEATPEAPEDKVEVPT